MINILYWNVRGDADSKLPGIIQDHKKLYKFDVLVISEPKISGERAKTVANSLGFSEVSIEDATGFSGGI